MENISEDKPKNDEDLKCAPGKEFKYGSCIDLEVLVLYSKAYNDEFPDSKIILDDREEIMHPHRYKKYLVKELDKRLSEKCTTQKCWTEQSFVKRLPSIKREELEKYTFRPEGPADSEEWLSNLELEAVLKQYEKKYPKFHFAGAVARNCIEYNMCPKNIIDYEDILKNNKTQVGLIYNTDYVGNSGEHWNALFADFEKNAIYFFDSYGTKPNSDVVKMMEIIENVMKKRCGLEKADIHRNKTNFNKCSLPSKKHNTVRHQYGDNACGVYSTNFILRMLKGQETFDEICNSKIKDEHVGMCRKVYFSKDQN